jgi:hypothetical protein
MAAIGDDPVLASVEGLDDLRLLSPWHVDPLGRWATVLGGDGVHRTLRWVDATLDDEQRQALQRLWITLSSGPAWPSVERIYRWNVGNDATWALSEPAAEQSLAERLARDGPSSPEESADLLRQLAQGLEAIHNAGLVHGGVSPSTVAWAGDWRLTSVGLAPILLPLPPAGPNVPADDVTRFAAPELLRGEEATKACDLFALGLTVTEASGGVIDPANRGLASVLSELTASRPEQRRLLRLPVPEPAPHIADEDVQFTVYRPKAVRPSLWYTMLAFAHKTDEFDDPDGTRVDPVAQVHRMADAMLGPQAEAYQATAADSRAALPRGSELTLVPRVDGVRFNPPQRSFLWLEPVHHEVFRLQADPALAGSRARGSMFVFFGSLLIAEVSLSIAVDVDAPDEGMEEPEAERARRYRKIFASYSHRDADVVAALASAARAFGDELVVDRTHLRTGEPWSDSLERLIDESDVFQLFWSRNSMVSPHVRDEWTYALSLGREAFIRPVYWEDPLPAQPEADLPPVALSRLHFHRLSTVPARPARPPAPPVAAGPVERPHMAEPVRPPASAPGPSAPPPPPASDASPSDPDRPRRRGRVIAVLGGIAAAIAAVTTMVGLGGGGDTARPEIAAVEVGATSLCVAGDPRTADVRAVVTRPDEVVAVVLEITSDSSRVEPTPMRPERTANRGNYVATIGPFVRAGEVRFTVQLTDSEGRTVRSPAERVAVLATC